MTQYTVGLMPSYIRLDEVVDPLHLKKMMDDDRVSSQTHPTLPLIIYNYTPRAQYLNQWNETEVACRGLIVTADSGHVIARGPAKFFNYGQKGAPELSLDSLTRVTTKHDGSLGIGWHYDGHFGVATRGSFTSDQAKHATAMLTEAHKDQIYLAASSRVKGGMTACWEIIYKQNRIVLDYGDRDELIELGQVDNKEGKFRFRPESMYRTPVITLAEAIAMPVPDDEEGYVLDIQPEGGQEHVKLKGERYKRLHALITNTSGQRIWVEMAARACEEYIDWENPKRIATLLGHDPADFLRVDRSKSLVDDAFDHVPDEFQEWFENKVRSIENTVDNIIGEAGQVADIAEQIEDRRERFEFLKSDLLCTEIMRYIDTKQIEQIVLKAWKLAKPSGVDTPFRTQED